MYSEFDVRKEIERIESSAHTPMRKARLLLAISRDLNRFGDRLHHGAHILRGDDDDGAERLQQTLDCLRRMQAEARFAAFRALGSKSKALTFRVSPEKTAYPVSWTKERMETNVTLS